MMTLVKRLVCLALVMTPLSAAAQSQPIVVLEYPTYGGTSAAPGLNPDNIFVSNPNHTASHRVMPDETLSHIITEHYAGSGLDLSVVQMAIVRRIAAPLCVEIPISCMRTKCCTCLRSTR